MSQAGRFVSGVIDAVCTIVTTFTRGGSPWKSEFATKASAPSGVSAIVVGNISTGARPNNESVPALIFHREPYGVPWAIVTYHADPSGATATLWGPSMSAGRQPTGAAIAAAHPA